ncbi:MAG: hypothetical protein GY805_29065, partial [Chloroflexi bacterium]|nr:hypothetical protein [Chloroflexota bacterium]
MAKIQLLELVGEHKKSSGLSYKKITTKANLSQSTIKNWAQGLSKKPRRWQDLAQFAAALKLNLPQVNQLLKAAGHPSIQALRKKNKSLELLAPWKREEAVLQIPRLLASAE